jgi:putative nucleotidyltransferase with HDIG domain
MGDGLAGQAATQQTIIHISNLNKEVTSLSKSPRLMDEGFISYYGVPLIAKGKIKGVLEIFHRTSFEPNPEWNSFLETLATETAIAMDNAEMFNDLQHSNLELTQAYATTLEGWSRALELRDRETEGHTQRVTEVTIELARRLGVDGNEIVHIRRGALLHDIGKMGIPDSILHKPGSLAAEEWEIMRQHPVHAFNLLSTIPFLRPALDIPHYHHEKWDGTGYPLGLKGEEIPLAARIFAVVDVWDALRSERPYRHAWKDDEVLIYILEQSNQHFDPKIVETFLNLINEMSEIIQRVIHP